MSYLIKRGNGDDAEYRSVDGNWTRYKHQAQDFGTKEKAEDALEAVRVFFPEAEVIER